MLQCDKCYRKKIGKEGAGQSRWDGEGVTILTDHEDGSVWVQPEESQGYSYADIRGKTLPLSHVGQFSAVTF